MGASFFSQWSWDSFPLSLQLMCCSLQCDRNLFLESELRRLSSVLFKINFMIVVIDGMNIVYVIQEKFKTGTSQRSPRLIENKRLTCAQVHMLGCIRQSLITYECGWW